MSCTKIPEVTDAMKNIVAEEYESTSNGGDGDGVGIHCVFIPVDDDFGIKCYRDERVALISQTRQSKACVLDIAPACGEMFLIHDVPAHRGFVVLFCYISETAELLYNEVKTKPDGIMVTDEIVVKIKEGLYSIGLEHVTDDLHKYNVGRLHGKLVCIDFVGNRSEDPDF